MKTKVNPYRIYLKATRQWVEVSEEYYRDHTRHHDALRKRRQYHGQCTCPKNKFWLCDGDCLTCEFRCAGDMLSLDYKSGNDNGDNRSMLDRLADLTPSIDDVVCEVATLNQLFERLYDLMPEAIQIGQLRLEGLSDEAIAKIIGIKRTTFRSRLKKAKEQLSVEFPEIF